MEHENFERHGTFSGDPLHVPAEGAEETVVSNSISVGLYNIHSLWEKKRDHFPASCELRTNFSVAESEESSVRYGHLFNPSFKNFDGYSTISPSAHIPRVYRESMMNKTDFVEPVKNFSRLIKGASYVASDCHNRDSANANRDSVVIDIRNAGFRVDGLGRCLKTPVGPEGIELSKDRASRYDLHLKREVVSNFAFNMAFENSYEDGYVTEKPFDALLSGSVPVYLGDSKQLKKLLPYDKAVIYFADFDNNATALVSYMNYLVKNETAYEEHRAWRRIYDLDEVRRTVPIMTHGWPCDVCRWAADHTNLRHKSVKHCKDEKGADGKVQSIEITDTTIYNGKAIRSSGKEVYYVDKNILRPIPDLNTLFSLNISLGKVEQIPERVFTQMKLGDSWPKATEEFPEVER